MAPTKGKTGPPKGSNKRSSVPSKSSSSSKGKSSSKSKSPSAAPRKAIQQKTKSSTPKHGQVRKKRRVYTDKELGIPLLNGIKPAGISKPKGVKKGKNFVDDKASMVAILAMVQAEKEGNIESKMIKARQMEEIREARKAELEKKKREQGRKKVLEDTKEEIRAGKRKGRKDDAGPGSKDRGAEKGKAEVEQPRKVKKKVSFG